MAAEIKIFSMNECDWIAARTLEEASEFIAKHYAYANVEDAKRDEIIEEWAHALDDSELDRLKYAWKTNDAYKEGDPDTYTFREFLAMEISRAVEFPCFFASTEF